MNTFRLAVIRTGGTIGSSWSEKDKSVRLVRDDQPEVRLVHQEWADDRPLDVTLHIPFTLSSEELTPYHWVDLADSIRNATQAGSDGVLVLHGTDTAAYSAAALSFLLSDLTVPIVLTGSSRPADHPRSDAAANVARSLVAVRHLEAGVHVCFIDASGDTASVHPGTRTRKLGVNGQVFETIGDSCTATVAGGQLIQHHATSRSQPVTPVSCGIEPAVLSLRLYPGLDLDTMWQVVTSANIRGVVVELYASGTGPTADGPTSLSRFATRCANAGVPLLGPIPSQTCDSLSSYESTAALEQAGMAALTRMSPEVATVKLMWSLAKYSGEEAIDLVTTPVLDEFVPGWS